LFWREAGLKRSLDKVYEIIVYSLFSVIVDCMGVSITINTNPDNKDILTEFADFSNMVLGLSDEIQSLTMPARIFRVGITNAADRGLDMYANFGYAIQIKHLSLNLEMANNIVSDISADKVIIVCKDSESQIIASLLTQIGWKARIQAIVTESHLQLWYEKALRGKHKDTMSENILLTLKQQIEIEFPATGNNVAKDFFVSRQYQIIENNHFWNVD
jgi:type II restriction enzyme